MEHGRIKLRLSISGPSTNGSSRIPAPGDTHCSAASGIRHWISTWTLAVLAIFAVLVTGESAAASFEKRTVRIVVGGNPGSPTDSLARTLADKLAPVLGQPVIVDNRPSAGGILAMDVVARARADGYTLGIATMSQLVFNAYLFSNLPYDPRRDFTLVAKLVSGPIVLVAHPSFVGNSLQDLVTMAKAEPRNIQYGIPQVGSPPHVIALMISRAAGIELTAVPFRGTVPALASALRGDIPLLFDGPAHVAPHVRAERLKALVLIGQQRDPLLPEVPTAAESGYPGMQMEPWIGLVAPSGIDNVMRQRIGTAVAAVLRDPDLKRTYEAGGWRVLGTPSDRFASELSEDHAFWGALIRESGLRLE